MSTNEYHIPSYPVIGFIVRRGAWITTLVALLILAGSVCLYVQGMGPGVVLAGVIVAILSGGVVASYIEVLRLISDTLMPK